MGRYRQWGSWTERGVILNADGMLRVEHSDSGEKKFDSVRFDSR